MSSQQAKRNQDLDAIGALLSHAGRLLLNDADLLSVERGEVGSQTIFVMKSDHAGALIGKGGSTAEALRLIAARVGTRAGVSVNVIIEDDKVRKAA